MKARDIYTMIYSLNVKDSFYSLKGHFPGPKIKPKAVNFTLGWYRSLLNNNNSNKTKQNKNKNNNKKKQQQQQQQQKKKKPKQNQTNKTKQKKKKERKKKSDNRRQSCAIEFHFWVKITLLEWLFTLLERPLQMSLFDNRE